MKLDPKLEQFALTQLKAMSDMYERKWTPKTGDEMVCPQSIVLIKGDYTPDTAPRPLADYLFSSPERKAQIPVVVKALLTDVEGALAVLVGSETWQAHCTDNVDHIPGQVRGMPGYKTSMMVMVYTPKDQWMYCQDMKDGKRDGEHQSQGPFSQGEARPSGRLVMEQ